MFEILLTSDRFALVLADVVYGSAVGYPDVDLGWRCGLDLQLVWRSGVGGGVDVFGVDGVQEEGGE